MKKITFLLVLALGVWNNLNASTESLSGVYKTKADFENERITSIGKIVESPNYNVGELNVEVITITNEKIISKVNCNKEDYFGFRYIDGNDYLLVDGVYARSVITGNINLLISPKANFKVDENEHYSFQPAPNGSLCYYFVKDMDTKVSSKFERLISDDRALLEKYKSDKLGNGDIVQKQLKYLAIYNSSYRETKKLKATSSSKHKKHK